MIDDVFTVDNWVGSLEQIQYLESLARNWLWEVRIEDPEYAADVAIGELKAGDAWIELHPDAESRLRAELEDSARAHNLMWYGEEE